MAEDIDIATFSIEEDSKTLAVPKLAIEGATSVI
jgi:hypothetical protein